MVTMPLAWSQSYPKKETNSEERTLEVLHLHDISDVTVASKGKSGRNLSLKGLEICGPD